MVILIMSITILTTSFTAYAQVSGSTSLPQNNIAKPAGPITAGSTWYEFSHSGAVIGTVSGCFPTDPLAFFGCLASGGGNSVELDTPPWTFICGSGGCSITLTDAFIPGDEFALFDGPVFLGVSVAPGGPGAGDVSDPANTSIDGAWSTRTFLFGPGPHSITLIQTVGGGGAAYFQLIDQSPVVGGKIIPIDATSLLLANTQSFSWMIPVVLSVLGIGLFVVSRKSENS